MKTIFFFLMMLASILAHTQNKTIDSLQKILQTSKEDTAKVNTLNALAYEFKNHNIDTGFYFVNQAVVLATRLNYEMGIADAKINSGKLYANAGKYNEGMQTGNEALILYNKFLASATASTRENILFKIANSYNVLVLNTFPQGNYPDALKFAFLELKIREDLNDKPGISTAQFNIGNIYYCQHNYSEALTHHFVCLAINRQLKNKGAISSSYDAIGLVYFDQGNYAEASKYYSAGLALAKEVNDNNNLAEIYVNLVLLEYKNKNYNDALKYGFAALQIYKKIGLNFNIPFVLNNMALVYMKQRKYDDASENLANALSIAKETNHLEYIKLSYENLATLDSLQGNFKKSLSDYKLAIAYRDSLINDENTKKMVQQQMQYDFDKKEDSTKAAQDKKDIITTAEIKNQKLIRNFSYAGTLLVFGFASIGFYRFRRRKKLQSQQEMLNERLRISRELHDDIGSTLGSISIYSEVARNRGEKNENANEVLSKIGVASRELIDKMSDIVWSINPNNEGFEQLQNRMQAFAAMILTPRNILYDFIADDEIKKLKLSAEELKNIFLIFKEAIHNSVKYAECLKVDIKLTLQNHQLVMVIKDDGKGFDSLSLSAGQAGFGEGRGEVYNGNGLKNMRARADDIHASLNIRSAVNQGTTIELKV